MHERPTIGFLVRDIQDSRFQEAWHGIADVLRVEDVNLMCIPSGDLFREDLRQANQRMIVCDLVTPQRLDGLIVFQWWEDRPGVAEFYARYAPLPIVTICPMELDSPTVRADYYEGTRVLMRHFIEEHDFRRIAYFRGPVHHAGANTRFRGYEDELAAHGIALDERLLPEFPNSGDEWERGRAVMRRLLDEHGMQPGRDFDAIAAWHDGIAIGASEVLQERGIRVPYDVALAGFGGRIQTAQNAPPMTTMQVPWGEMGRQAAQHVLTWMRDGTEPEDLVVVPKLVARRSCGCLAREVTQISARLHLTSHHPATPSARRETLIDSLLQAGLDEWLPGDAWIGELVDAVLTDISPQAYAPTIPHTFLSTLESQCYQVAMAGGQVEAGQIILSILHYDLLPWGTTQAIADQLLHQGRVVIEQITRWAKDRRQAEERQQAEVLRWIGQQLITTFDVPGLLKIVTEGVPRLNIPGVYLALYVSPDAPTDQARLILACNEQGCRELPPDGELFASSCFVPEARLPRERSYHLAVEPLHFGDEQIGLAVFEVGPRDGQIYEILRGELSSAIQGALLVQQVHDRSAEIARQKYILDSFMENVPDPIYFKDIQSRFIQVNQAFATNFGKDEPAAFVGKSDFDLFSEEEARPKYEMEQNIISSGEALLDKEIPHPGGQWALTTKMPLRDGHGKIIGTFGISRNITELKQAQKALEEAYSEISTLNVQLKEENVRMGAELDVARRLQAMVLPSAAELHEIQGLDIAGYMKPADEVGGDYYDILKKNGIVHIGIGDVTGHGLESGVLMLMTQSIVRALIEHGETDPVKFMSTLNRTLYKNVQRMGVDKTLTLSLVEYRDGVLHVVGQHEEVLVVRRAGQIERVNTMELGFPLGLEEDIAAWVATRSISLQSGDGIVLYTDGITEAENQKQELYGLERLRAVINRKWPGNTAHAVQRGIIDDVMRHIGTQTMYDDLTLVVLKEQ